jgi:hypothetical protein
MKQNCVSLWSKIVWIYEAKLCEFMKQNFVSLWSKIVWVYEAKLCEFMKQNCVSLWSKIMWVYEAKLCEFMKQNTGRAKCTTESIILTLVEAMMDSMVLKNHEIRQSTLPKFNEMFYASRWTRVLGTKCQKAYYSVEVITVYTLAACCIFTDLTVSVILSVSVFIRVIWAVYLPLRFLYRVCALWNWYVSIC